MTRKSGMNVDRTDVVRWNEETESLQARDGLTLLGKEVDHLCLTSGGRSSYR